MPEGTINGQAFRRTQLFKACNAVARSFISLSPSHQRFCPMWCLPSRTIVQPRVGPQHLINPPQQTNTATGTPVPPPPAIDKTSALGQALAACNQNEAAQDTFALPGLKGEITLDHCYKGRAHLICVFTALNMEANSLTGSYTKIVDAKYPDLNTVDGLCQLNPETLASDIAGSEDFTKEI